MTITSAKSIALSLTGHKADLAWEIYKAMAALDIDGNQAHALFHKYVWV